VRIFLNFPLWKHRQYCRKAFPPPSPHSVLFRRTEVSSEEFSWQSNIDKRERGCRFVVVSSFQGQSSHSFRSVSTVLSEIVREGFGDLSRICIVVKAPGSILSVVQQGGCFKSFLPGIDFEFKKLGAELSCLSFYSNSCLQVTHLSLHCGCGFYQQLTF